MVATARPIRIAIGSLGLLILVPALVSLFSALLGNHSQDITVPDAAFALLITGGYFTFWFGARTDRGRMLAAGFVVLATLLSVLLPTKPILLTFWAYPALVIGFLLRPLWAILVLAGVALLAFVIDAVRSAEGVTPGLTTVGTLALLSWASITVAQLISSNIKLQQAREELARHAVEEERTRFARDVHDVLGQTLTLIVAKQRLASRLLDNPEAAAVELKDAETLTRDALREVREVAGGYRQPTLTSELSGARVALETAGMQAIVDKDVGMLSRDIEATLAWIVREGVTNVVRHSGARTCSIRIHSRDRVVIVDVIDDGGGARGAPTGMGLAGLRERVEAKGGALIADSPASGGFHLWAELPS
jgi:two-component system, NarL family, sensor histidine kinase DesK